MAKLTIFITVSLDEPVRIFDALGDGGGFLNATPNNPQKAKIHHQISEYKQTWATPT